MSEGVLEVEGFVLADLEKWECGGLPVVSDGGEGVCDEGVGVRWKLLGECGEEEGLDVGVVVVYQGAEEWCHDCLGIVAGTSVEGVTSLDGFAVRFGGGEIAAYSVDDSHDISCSNTTPTQDLPQDRPE